MPEVKLCKDCKSLTLGGINTQRLACSNAEAGHATDLVTGASIPIGDDCGLLRSNCYSLTIGGGVYGWVVPKCGPDGKLWESKE